MSESQQQPALTEQDQFEARRAFLKKAGLGAVGLGALWAVPRISTVKAAPAYTAATAPPCTVALISPAADAVVPQVQSSLTWQPVAGALGYRVTLKFGSCDNPGNPLIGTATTNTSYPVNFAGPAFANGGIFHWKVEALDSPNGNIGNTICESECRNFTVEAQVD